jgi:RNA polymerase sigma factor (sigma-70 family)
VRLFKIKQKEISEQELVSGCVAGKREMQRLLYERHAATMKGVCLRYAATSFEAEDLLHDAFMKVFTHLSTFKMDSPLEVWIRKIVVNTALSYKRSTLSRIDLTDAAQLETLTEPQISLPETTAEELVELIQCLPEKYRLTFNLHAIEGYSYPEISALLQQTEAATRSQYLRARNMLKEMLDKEYRTYHEKSRSI